MAEYNMQELNLPGEDGKRILYPRMKLYGQVNLETITEKIAYASSFTRETPIVTGKQIGRAHV